MFQWLKKSLKVTQKKNEQVHNVINIILCFILYLVFIDSNNQI